MRPWEITAHDFFSQVEAVRGLFAQVIGGDADGVAVLPAVSYGVAIAASNLPFSRGDRVVLMTEQFPSNVYSWHDLAAVRGGEVVTVPRPPDGDWTQVVLGAIDERTRIVSVEPCHWSDGGLLDVGRVGVRAREVGAAFVVDGTQWVGAVPFDVTEVRPDFLITAVYKWLLAPYGAALMWCAPDRREGRPLELSWITRLGSSDFAGLVDYESELRPGARRYDVGQTSNFAMMAAVETALEQTLHWGVEAVSEYVARLGDLIAERASGMGLGVAPQHLRARHLIGVHLKGADLDAAADALAKANVYVSVRGDAMRVSPHVYNDERDVDRLFEALQAVI
jgi:selenocysteine lyase/cysteine desulfurase